MLQSCHLIRYLIVTIQIRKLLEIKQKYYTIINSVNVLFSVGPMPQAFLTGLFNLHSIQKQRDVTN